MDIEAELISLNQRVRALEEILDTLTGHFRTIQPELVALQAEAARRFDTADGMMSRIVSRLDTVNTQVWSLRDDLPLLMQRALEGDVKPLPEDAQD